MSDEVEMTLFQQAGSILGTIRASLMDGRLLATEEMVQARATVCMSCDKLRQKHNKFSCVTCGCGFKRKISIHGSACPLGKW